jgi:hypothetical protein
MGFRIYAEPHPQPISEIKDSVWDDVMVELLGRQYDYLCVWGDHSKWLTTEGIQWFFDKCLAAKNKLCEEKGIEVTEDRFDFKARNRRFLSGVSPLSAPRDPNFHDSGMRSHSFKRGETEYCDEPLPRHYEEVMTFLKQSIDNKNDLRAY